MAERGRTEHAAFPAGQVKAVRGLVTEALAAAADLEKSGEVYRAEDAHAWMGRLAADASAPRPKPWRR